MPTAATTSSTDKALIESRCVKGVTRLRLRLRDRSEVIAVYNGWSDDYGMARVIMPGNKHQQRRISVDDIIEGDGSQLTLATATASSSTVISVAVDDLPLARVAASQLTRTSDAFSVGDRFEFLESLTDMVVNGDASSLIVTGSGGLGKSYTVTQRVQAAGLKEDEDYVVYKGFATPKSLYRALYENRDNLIIFDDCDSVLEHATSLNLLKGALDSYDTRTVSWLSERPAEDLPDSFEFRGRVIFISNKTISEVDQPIVSRALFVDLTMTAMEKVERLRMLLPRLRPDVDIALRQECLDLIAENAERISDLNIRSLLKTLVIRSSNNPNWRRLALYSIIANTTRASR